MLEEGHASAEQTGKKPGEEEGAQMGFWKPVLFQVTRLLRASITSL